MCRLPLATLQSILLLTPTLPRYRMGSDPAGWLAIDPETGIVTAAQPLDRESVHAINSTYKAIVLAVDSGEQRPAAPLGTGLPPACVPPELPRQGPLPWAPH